MERRTIGIAVLALLLLTGFIGGYVLYIRSEAYLIGVARGRGPVFDRTSAMTALFNKQDPERVVPVFIELLGDEDSTVRQKAAEDLGFMRAKAAVDPLIAALPKQSAYERKTFIEALGTISDARAAPVLLALLGNAKDEEAYTIAVALAKLGPDAVPALLEHLADPKWAVRSAVAAGLGWIGRDATPDLRREVVGPIVAPLIPLLYDPIPEVRSSAADAMGNIRDSKFLNSLLLALGDPDDKVQEVVARVVSYYGDAAIALLPPVFQSADPRVRLGAAEAYAAIAYIGVYDLSRSNASYVMAARAVLDEALQRKDLVAGAGAFGYYITQGRSEAVPFLKAALEAYGHRRMANGLLNCGLASLHDAAAAWAKAHGYSIETGIGPGEYKWGKG